MILVISEAMMRRGFESCAIFVSRLYLLFLLIAVPGHAMANLIDDGEDFSNNLASDLAPLLALFGERVTMQFMSESMGWADSIMLAMAPLGVITILVSAIRVCGYRWLRALIGRSTENTVTAELEVLSCTSNESCELHDGQTVVRCLGKADICEFICIYPPKPAREITAACVMDIKEALSYGNLLEMRRQESCRTSIVELSVISDSQL
ncbi:ankyrin repeat protein [Colletotrichum chrysophilum]|uniref:Ankyrin repeat protein n=1 Tax=Colletotrichum chrysophilum TaxID=1836956 RepID=A0AAD9E8X0_9PEZI|nr:ankyrin repeat protein [Colletotrichum chrysophilum]